MPKRRKEGVKMALQNDEILIYKDPVKLLQKLIRYNTTNPPGNEADCIKYLNDLLSLAGIETTMVGKEPERQNLIARLKGQGKEPPFLMYGHVDVVAADGNWSQPPFEGVIMDECVWGRGTLDMKGAIVMMVCALLRAKVEGFVPSGDIILAVVGDEEASGEYGAKYLVENYSDMFKDVKYAIGEIGGFTLHMSGKRFYPIMVAEKQKCSIKAVIKGPGGHGSMPLHGGAMAKLGNVLKTLDAHRLPVHVTPPASEMIDALASHLPFPASMFLRGLQKPFMTDKILNIMGEQGNFFDPILHNTVNATIVRGGNKINVIPGEITLELDGRILPGFKASDMIKELQNLLGRNAEFEVTEYVPGPSEINMGLFHVLEDILKEGDKDGIPIPFVVSGCTDARFFSQLGIQTYGFTPMILPQDISFAKLIHGEDERIPIKALEFGVNSIFRLLNRLGDK